jgi:hypothetical protein
LKGHKARNRCFAGLFGLFLRKLSGNFFEEQGILSGTGNLISRRFG